MSRIIVCKLAPRLGELRKLLDYNTSSPVVLNKHEDAEKDNANIYSLGTG